MKKTTVKTTVVKFLMRIVFAVLLLTAIPASGNSTTITAHAAVKAVKPTAVKKITKVKTTKNSISVKWPKSKNATGYQLRAYKNSRLVKKSSVKAAKATIEGLSTNTTYKISVRAYRKSGKNTAYSTWKSVSIKTAKAGTSIAKPANVETVLNAGVTESSIRVVWPTPMNATGYPTGYQIRTYKGASLVNEVTTKKTEITIKKLKDGTTYKIKVRSYRKSGNNTAYGAWKSISVKTVKKFTDKEIAATGIFGGTGTLEVGCHASDLKWKNCNGPVVDKSKVKWTVSDSSKLKLTPIAGMKNTMAAVKPLKSGTVTVTLTYAGYTVGSMTITIVECPASWTYWETGCTYLPERYAEIKKFNESINDWVAKNITKNMSEYEKATKAADHVKTYMTYKTNNVGKDMVELWNGRKGGVCAHAAGILDCFLRKMQIDTCVGHISRNDHPTNWTMLDGQKYEIDATFWDGTEMDKNADIRKISTDKPDDGTNVWRYPTE